MTHSGSVFWQWKDIKEYMIDLDIDDLTLSLPHPTVEWASEVKLTLIPPSLDIPKPSVLRPSPSQLSKNKNTTSKHLHCQQYKNFKTHQKFHSIHCETHYQVQECTGLPVKQIVLKHVATSSVLATMLEPAC